MGRSLASIPMRNAFQALSAVALTLACAGAAAASSDDYGSSLHTQVPISALARPAAWLDPSRLKLSTEFMIGSGFGGPTQGLQVTRLQYQFGQPLAMRVSLGNSFGTAPGRDAGFFLEGLDLSYQPFGSLLVQVHYQDVRSPLQYGRSGFQPSWR